MNIEEITEAVRNIPLGSIIQLIKKNGSIVEVRLASHEVLGTEAKDYGDIKVPALPPAIIVTGRARFGQYRIDAEDIVNISWIA